VAGIRIVARPSPTSTISSPVSQRIGGGGSSPTDLASQNLTAGKLVPDALAEDAILGRRTQVGIGRLLWRRLDSRRLDRAFGRLVDRRQDREPGGAVSDQALTAWVDQERLGEAQRASDVDRLPVGGQRRARSRRAQERQRELGGGVGSCAGKLRLDRAAKPDVGHHRQGAASDQAGGVEEPT
jgi:hypothetical protein